MTIHACIVPCGSLVFLDQEVREPIYVQRHDPKDQRKRTAKKLGSFELLRAKTSSQIGLICSPLFGSSKILLLILLDLALSFFDLHLLLFHLNAATTFPRTLDQTARNIARSRIQSLELN